MLLLSLIALALFGLSAVLVARALALPDIRSAERVRSIDLYGYDAAAPAAAAAVDAPAFSAVAGRIGGGLVERLKIDSAGTRKLLVTAGFYRLTPASLFGYRVVVAGVMSVLMLLSAPGGYPLAILWTGFAAFFGWFLPLGYVRRAARLRTLEVDRGLPNLIDLVVVTVEAGLTLPAAMQLASSRIDGPVGDEIRLTLQEQQMGRSLHDALLGMLGRCDTPNMRSFVRSVTQGENLGVSVGQIMRSLADEMRKRRRAEAEKQAQKAPVKILIPLVFLILPAFLITIVTPPVMRMIENFGS